MTAILILLFAFLIIRLTRRGDAGLSRAEVVAAFAFKVLLACAYGYLFLHYYGGDDTWKIHNEALDEYKVLMNDPAKFFGDFNPARVWRKINNDHWLALRIYLADLEYFQIAKPLGIFNIISKGNYYANAVFFSFLTFWGHYWLFKLMTTLFPQKRKALLLLIFFFPPVVFWLSGIRTDGLIFLYLSLLLLHAFKWLHQHKKSSILYALLGLIGILILRDMLILLLLPALISWFVTITFNRKPLPVFAIVYSLSILLFFSTAYLPGVPNLPLVIVERQQEFLALKGNTRFQLDPLQPAVESFMNVLPQAVSNTFLRPFLWEAKGFLQLMAAVEIMLCWVLVALALIRRDKTMPAFSTCPVCWVLLFFSVFLYLFLGYVVPFPGAIVRYKVIPELFLMALLLVQIRPPKGKLLS
ncbi:hypothetical protein [Paraflavitalea speifideaquila]|uniref:hypothetical protein n=1 Tax=Paraflavitalea speifideaquila TaxID=3076558 RepID=UPI0028E9EEFA|nr:hypothetical protein [Paraflavitalea speifideiaquila]